jgi:predicted amidophosphoribosyltransferase
MCVNDAPKVEQEIAQMQAQAQLGQLKEKVDKVDFTEGLNVERKQVALCPNCGAEAEPSAKFCGSCGQALTMPVACGKCGTESPRGTKFCPECGNQL